MHKLMQVQLGFYSMHRGVICTLSIPFAVCHGNTEEEKEGEGGLVAGDVQTTSERKMKFQEVSGGKTFLYLVVIVCVCNAASEADIQQKKRTFSLRES